MVMVTLKVLAAADIMKAPNLMTKVEEEAHTTEKEI